MQGWVAGNPVRDVAALSKREPLPWDMWSGIPGPEEPITEILAAENERVIAVT